MKVLKSLALAAVVLSAIGTTNAAEVKAVTKNLVEVDQI